MKIAFLTTDNRENDRRYDLVAPYFGTAPEALLQGFAGIPDLEVHVVSCAQRPMRSPDKLASNIWFHSLHVPKGGWLRSLYLGCIRAVRRKLRELNPELVHGQGTERDCAITAVFCGFPNVVTIHGNMRLIAQVNAAKPFSYLWLAAKLERFLIPRTNGIICISSYTQKAVRELTRKTWIVPNAVDQSFFRIESRLRARPIILCVGNICPRKNQNAFIRALDPLSPRMDLELRFLGDAPPAEPYSAEFFNLLRTRPWCQYNGFVDRDPLKQQLAEAAIVTVPSLEENCPMVILEAMAAGVPVAASNVGGIPDLIENNITGSLFNPMNAEDLRQTIASILTNRDRAQSMAKTARQCALDRFHPETIARRQVEIYREVLSTSS